MAVTGRIGPILVLSSDTKPITDVVSGRKLVETDTNKRFIFNGSAWIEHNPFVNLAGPMTAFGELSVAELTPLIQLQFPYAVNTRLVTSLTAGSGAASVASSLLTVSTGVTTASDVLFRSIKDAKYHSGQGTVARWTSIFQAAGTADTEALSGLGNEEDALGFGYNGTVFGLLHRFAGKQEHQTLTVSAGAGTATGTITITLDGTATEVEVVLNDTQEAVVRAIDAVTFVGWETQAIGDTVVFISHLAEVKAGAFSFVDTEPTGTAAAFVETITGVGPTNTWIPQTEWNVDRCLFNTEPDSSPAGFTLDHDTGNVYQVRFQWLGFGPLKYYIEHPDTSELILVHIIKYINRNISPSIQNPTLPLYISVKNKTTTTDITVKASSMAVFTEGAVDPDEGLTNSAVGTATGDLTTETSILAIKSKPVFQGIANRVEFRPLLLSFSANGAGNAKFTTLKVVINPILGGDPSFTDIDTNGSTLAFDTAGTTVTGGSDIATFEFGRAVDNFVLDISGFVSTRPPGTLLCFTGTVDGGTSDMDVGIVVQELF